MEDDDDPTTYLINNKLSSNKSFEKNSNNNIENNISINIPRKTFSLKNLYKFGEIPIEESITTFFFRPVQHGSLKSSIFCMICVTLGTGMLPIPYLFYSNGLILTFILYLIFSFPTYFTLQLLII